MGHGGLYALVFLGLIVVASERAKNDVTRCWAKGKEVTIHPHQCPAEFDGVDAKFCCRLCYGANCCLPRKPRVNLAKCPRDARLAGAIRDRRADLGAETSAAPDAETTAHPNRKSDWTFLGLVLAVLILAVVYMAIHHCFLNWKKFWDFLAKHCYEGEGEGEGAQATVNTVSSGVLPQNPLRSNVFPDFLRRTYAVHMEAPPPYTRFDPEGSQDLPPPYPGEPARDPQGARDLPPPYPGEPVVVFRRSSSHVQEDVAVILPGLAAPPEATATASALEGAATGGAAELADFLEAAAIGNAPEEMDLSEAAAIGNAPEEVDLPEAAAIGGAPEEVDLPEAAAIGGAPEEVDLPEAAAIGGAPEEEALLGAAASGGAPEPPE